MKSFVAHHFSQPQIIGFGAQKSGTSWLFDNLVRNPAIWRPRFKEMHFFSSHESGSKWVFSKHKNALMALHADLQKQKKLGQAKHIARLLDIPMLSEEWYREAYAPCPSGMASIDITPAYALLKDRGIEHMHKLLGPDFKAIFLIRDPVERALSSMKSIFARKTNKRALTDEWLRQLREQTIWRRCDYRETVERLDRMLGNRVIYLPFGQIKKNPVDLLRSIEQHCGLPQGLYPAAGQPSFVSPKVEMPEGIRDVFREALEAQYSFIEDRFEADFSRQT